MQITCKSHANHMQITFKSHANHMQITYKDAYILTGKQCSDK